MLAAIADFVDRSAAEIVDAVCRLVRLPSVKAAAAPGAPFGEDIGRALDQVLSTARGMGFDAVDGDGYYGLVEWGTGPETVCTVRMLASRACYDAKQQYRFVTTLYTNPGVSSSVLYALVARAKTNVRDGFIAKPPRCVLRRGGAELLIRLSARRFSGAACRLRRKPIGGFSSPA
jgi:hypothetical protein